MPVRACLARCTALGTLLSLPLGLAGFSDQPPLLSAVGGNGPSGYSVLVAQRVATLLGQAVRRGVSLHTQDGRSGSQLDQAVSGGGADLACPATMKLAAGQGG